MPVQYLVVGVGTGIGVGVNSVLSKKLGEKDGNGVNKTAGNGFVLLWIVMVLFAVLGLTAMEPFYRIQTDIQEIRDMCISYSIVLCVCSFAAFHQIMMERLLAAIGRADLTMVPMLVGAVVNIILDPVMIFGWFGFPAMGITGAGIATVTAQAVAAVAGLLLNLRLNHEVHISGRAFVPNMTVVGEILKIGIPVALSNCLVAVIALGMNNILMGLSPLAPGIYVIYIRLQSFVIMPSAGMSSAGISIIAYNYGAKEKKRIMEALWKSLRMNAPGFPCIPGTAARHVPCIRRHDGDGDHGSPVYCRGFAAYHDHADLIRFPAGDGAGDGKLSCFRFPGGIPAAFCMDICTDRKHYAGLAGVPGYGDHPLCDCGNYGQMDLSGKNRETPGCPSGIKGPEGSVTDHPYQVWLWIMLFQ